MNYRIIKKNLSDEEPLSRCMDVAKYLSLLSSKSIWLARPDTFKDQREGSFPDSMKSELIQSMQHYLSALISMEYTLLIIRKSFRIILKKYIH